MKEQYRWRKLGEAVNEMKSGKAPGLDGFPVECLKKCGIAVLEWLVRLLNLKGGSLTFKLAVLVISIFIDCDRGHCYEHFKKKIEFQ